MFKIGDKVSIGGGRSGTIVQGPGSPHGKVGDETGYLIEYENGTRRWVQTKRLVPVVDSYKIGTKFRKRGTDNVYEYLGNDKYRMLTNETLLGFPVSRIMYVPERDIDKEFVRVVVHDWREIGRTDREEHVLYVPVEIPGSLYLRMGLGKSLILPPTRPIRDENAERARAKNTDVWVPKYKIGDVFKRNTHRGEQTQTYRIDKINEDRQSYGLVRSDNGFKIERKEVNLDAWFFRSVSDTLSAGMVLKAIKDRATVEDGRYVTAGDTYTVTRIDPKWNYAYIIDDNGEEYGLPFHTFKEYFKEVQKVENYAVGMAFQSKRDVKGVGRIKLFIQGNPYFISRIQNGLIFVFNTANHEMSFTPSYFENLFEPLHFPTTRKMWLVKPLAGLEVGALYELIGDNGHTRILETGSVTYNSAVRNLFSETKPRFFKVGQRVYSQFEGWGLVSDTSDDLVRVEFGNARRGTRYTEFDYMGRRGGVPELSPKYYEESETIELTPIA